MGTSAVIAPPGKAVATVALVGVDEATSRILQDCFRQFGIYTVTLPREEAARLQKEKFYACAVPLDEQTEELLQLVRKSPSNAKIVVYGIGGSVQQALRFCRYGINAVFEQPVDRQAALRVVRATHLLVLHELRRYVRVPLISTLIIETGTQRLQGSTAEISAGGLSLHVRGKLAVPQTVEVSFELPGFGAINCRGDVCWLRRDESMAGVRYDVNDERRLRVREWIEEYLGL